MVWYISFPQAASYRLDIDYILDIKGHLWRLHEKKSEAIRWPGKARRRKAGSRKFRQGIMRTGQKIKGRAVRGPAKCSLLQNDHSNMVIGFPFLSCGNPFVNSIGLSSQDVDSGWCEFDECAFFHLLSLFLLFLLLALFPCGFVVTKEQMPSVSTG